MAITTVRPAADMMSCARVFVRSSRDLARRMGNTPPPTRPADIAAALAHLRRTDPRGFQVAVKSERVVAFAATILRGNTHFLSMFWALPGLQSQGVGRRVLSRAFDGPRPPASAVRCVYASLDTRAQVLYLKFGMRPRGMFYLLKGAPNPSPRPKHAVELEPVGKPGRTSPRILAIAARFDLRFRAARRDADIRFVSVAAGSAVLHRARRQEDHRLRDRQRERPRGTGGRHGSSLQRRARLGDQGSRAWTEGEGVVRRRAGHQRRGAHRVFRIGPADRVLWCLDVGEAGRVV